MLDALAKGQELRESMTRQEFHDDWKASYAAAILLAVGEHMGPGTPHASADVARPFHEARNLLAHEYFHVSPDRLWLLLERNCAKKWKPARNRRRELPDHPPTIADLYKANAHDIEGRRLLRRRTPGSLAR